MKHFRTLFFVTTCLLVTYDYGLSQNENNASAKRYQDYQVADSIVYRYTRPKPFKFLIDAPKTIGVFTVQAFKRDNLWKTGAMAGGTAMLTMADQGILDASQQFGRYINLSQSRKITTLVEFNFFGQPAPIEVPANFSSALYYIGEGWPSLFTTLGIYSYGLIKNDYRALSTASQLVETMVAIGFTCQFIKRVSGRESPFVATRSGGKWRPLPHPSDYADRVPKYDAFPSGHMATLVGTCAVIMLNYPEKKFMKPLTLVLATVLGYQMMNNGVHWFSDYPLAIALGYGFAKIAVNRYRKIIDTREGSLEEDRTSSVSFSPMISNGSFGVGFKYKFP